jgi:hypothetical protein
MGRSSLDKEQRKNFAMKQNETIYRSNYGN